MDEIYNSNLNIFLFFKDVNQSWGEKKLFKVSQISCINLLILSLSYLPKIAESLPDYIKLI